MPGTLLLLLLLLCCCWCFHYHTSSCYHNHHHCLLESSLPEPRPVGPRASVIGSQGSRFGGASRSRVCSLAHRFTRNGSGTGSGSGRPCERTVRPRRSGHSGPNSCCSCRCSSCSRRSGSYRTTLCSSSRSVSSWSGAVPPSSGSSGSSGHGWRRPSGRWVRSGQAGSRVLQGQGLEGGAQPHPRSLQPLAGLPFFISPR